MSQSKGPDHSSSNAISDVLGSFSSADDSASRGGLLYLDARHAGHELTLPIGNALLDADFIRSHSDLHIQIPNHDTIFVQDYFHTDTPPALLSDNGQKLDGATISTLAGSQAPAQFAGPTGEKESIGVVEKLSGTVTVTHADGTSEAIKPGAHVFADDVIKTDAKGSVGITFNDKSVFSLGENAKMTLDDMVYDPQTHEGSSSVTVVKGMFKFVSGDIAANNPGDMVIKTPVATIGIRGTTGGGQVYGEGQQNKFFLEPNADGTVGWVDIITDKGKVSMNQPNMMLTVSSIKQAPPAPAIVPAATITQQFQQVIQAAPESKYDGRSQGDQPNANDSTNAGQQPQEKQQVAADSAGQTDGEKQAAANGEQAPADQAAPGQVQGDGSQLAQVQTAETVTGENVIEVPGKKQKNPGVQTGTDSQADAQVDTQADSAAVNKPSPLGFIAVGMAALDNKPGFVAPGQANFVSSAPTGIASNIVAPPLNGENHTGTHVAGSLPDSSGNTALFTATGDAAATGTGLQNTPANAFSTSQASGRDFSNVLTTQGIPAGAPAQPATPGNPSPVPPVNTAPVPPVTNTPTNPVTPPVVSGGTPSGGGVTPPAPPVSRTFALVANESLTGDSGNDIFNVDSGTNFNVGDAASGGAGFDKLSINAAGITLTPLLLANMTGIDQIYFAAGTTADATLSLPMLAAADNQTLRIGTAASVTTMNLTTTPTPFNHKVILDPGALNVTLGSGGNTLFTASGNSNQTITGGNGNDYVVVTGGDNMSVTGGNASTDTNWMVVNGGTNHKITGDGTGTSFSNILMNNVTGYQINGGANKFVQVTGGYGTINASGGSNDITVRGNAGTTNITVGNGASDKIKVIGGTGSVNVTTGDGNDLISFDKNTTANSTITLNGTVGNTTNVVLEGLHSNLVINTTNSGTGRISLHGVSASALTFSYASTILTVSNGTNSIVFNNYTTNPLELVLDHAVDHSLVKAALGTPQEVRLLSTYATNSFTANILGSLGTPQTLSTPSTSYQGSNLNDFVFLTGTSATINGGDGDDYLKANGTGQFLYGGNGDDLLIKYTSASSVRFFGDTGFDTVDYRAITASSVIIDLGAGTGGGGASGDLYTSIEGAIGTGLSDSITGASGAGKINILEGGVGDDSIAGGSGGAFNTVSYEHWTGGDFTLKVDFTQGTYGRSWENGAWADMFTNSYIQNMIGSDFRDSLTGSAADNIIYGRDGVDTISGGGGNDIIIGGGGGDQISLDSDNTRDIVLYEKITDSGDVINGFDSNIGVSNNDMIDISNLVQQVKPGMNYFDLVNHGYLQVTNSGSSATVGFDLNGGGSFTTLATVNFTGGVGSLDFTHFLLGLGSKAISGSGSLNATAGIPTFLIGDASNNTLQGNDQPDTLYGGGGVNIMNGDGGNDTFIVMGSNLTTSGTQINGGLDSNKMVIFDTNFNVAPGNIQATIQDIGRIDLTTHDLVGGLTANQVSLWNSTDKELRIDGMAGHNVELKSGDWSQLGVNIDAGYTTYVSNTYIGGQHAVVHVATNLNVSNV